MSMDFSVEPNDLISIMIAVLCGGIIGFEREYKNKSTGFRTIMLITLGSTLFTIVSRHGAGSDDRVSANIITGVGFIGAGVIFKDKLSVLGLTTAAVIWTSAAIGMTAGVGYHGLTIIITLITLSILVAVDRIELLIDNLQKNKVIRVYFRNDELQQLIALEERIKMKNLKSKRIQIYKEDDSLCAVIQLSGKRKNVDLLSQLMVEMKEIKSFN